MSNIRWVIRAFGGSIIGRMSGAAPEALLQVREKLMTKMNWSKARPHSGPARDERFHKMVGVHPTATCSFCGKDQREVIDMIAGPTVFICNECVALCEDIIRANEAIRAERREKERKAKREPT